ncbi:MAG: SDR family NAD(P)-dependent oxidoreductase [Acidobacteriota bacterium]
MDSGLVEKVVLITGASGGIGQATARQFAQEGSQLALHYHRGREAAEALARQLEVQSVVVGADIGSETEVDRMFEKVLEKFPRIDALVANAGIWIETSVPLHEMSLEQWSRTVETDLTGPFLTCRAFFRHLARSPRESASVVLVGSTAGLVGEENHADYAASKAALAYGLTLSLKNEIVRLAPLGRVNCVCPGWVDTPMASSAMKDASAVKRAQSTMALRKIATPEDVARAIVFLTSDRLAGHLTGTILPVAGGMEGRLLHPS